MKPRNARQYHKGSTTQSVTQSKRTDVVSIKQVFELRVSRPLGEGFRDVQDASAQATCQYYEVVSQLVRLDFPDSDFFLCLFGWYHKGAARRPEIQQ